MTWETKIMVTGTLGMRQELKTIFLEGQTCANDEGHTAR